MQKRFGIGSSVPRLVALGLLCAGSLGVCFAVDMHERYRDEIADAKAAASNYAEIVAEHTAMTSAAGHIGDIARQYGAIDLGHGGAMWLLRRNGQISVREPHVENAVGAPFADWPLLEQVLVASDAGVYETSGADARIGGYRAVPGQPLVAVVTYSRAEVLARWYAGLHTFGPFVAIIMASIMLGTFKLVRQSSKIAAETKQLELTNLRLDAALDNMAHGLCLFDADRKLVIANDRFRQMYDLTEAQVEPGTPLRHILQAHADSGEPSVLPVDNKVNQILSSAAETTLLADGRVISIHRRFMPDGGWVATHEDITERRRLEQQADQNRAFLHQIIDLIPTHVTVKDARDRRYVLMNRAAIAQLGVSPDEMIGKSAHDIFPKPTADVITADDDKALKSDSGVLLGEHKFKTRTLGVRFITSKRVSIRDHAGNPAFLINVVDDVTERKRSTDRIAHLAHHDQLTGLANRACFAESIDQALERFHRQGTAFTLFMLDLDRFKNVNDTLGHAAGDQLLVEVSQRLKSSLRPADLLARLGGDEFAIIRANEGHQREDAVALAGTIIDVIARPFDLNGSQVTVGTCIGVAFVPESDLDAQGLLGKADLALYAAKSKGRSNYRLFQPEMAEASNSQKILESELRDAIAQDQFELHYQPVVDAATGIVRAAEALVRWRHPARGLVRPDQFIPLAECTGLMVTLGEWVLRQACLDAAAWPSHLRIAINVSAVQFDSAGLFDVVVGALARSGLAAERLELEITESVLLKNEASHLHAIRQLKNIGVSLVLDDFGTGYSSLNYLTRFPFDKIKIDKSFIQGFPGRRESVAIVESVLALARGLDMTITAEGVETREQSESLRAAGVDLLQGYLFGRPVPLDELNVGGPGLAAKHVA